MGVKVFLPSLPLKIPSSEFPKILMSRRSSENLVNVGTIAFLLDTKKYVKPMAEYIVVTKLENGVMILRWILLQNDKTATYSVKMFFDKHDN